MHSAQTDEAGSAGQDREGQRPDAAKKRLRQEKEAVIEPGGFAFSNPDQPGGGFQTRFVDDGHSVRIAPASAARSTGLVRWASNPAASIRALSSGCPHPVSAMSLVAFPGSDCR